MTSRKLLVPGSQEALLECVRLLSDDVATLSTEDRPGFEVLHYARASVSGLNCCARSRTSQFDALRQLVALLASWLPAQETEAAE